MSNVIETKSLPREMRRNGPDAVIKADLDERAFLFPGPKQVQQLIVQVARPHVIRLDAVYAFNESRAAPTLLELSVDDAREVSRRIVEAVYRAQSCQIVTPTTSLGFTVIANGYILAFGDADRPRELFLSTGCIWRVCGALARAVDFGSPIQSN